SLPIPGGIRLGNKIMKILKSVLIQMVMAAAVFGATGGTISGTVTGTGGTPLRAAFVRIQNLQTRMNIHVLSDGKGHYQAYNVPAGEYRVYVSTLGYTGEPKNGVKIED